MKKFYTVLIAQNVIGKSKGLKGFRKYKPLWYEKSSDPHPIIYYKRIYETLEDIEWIKEVYKKKMFCLFSMNLGSDFSKILDYTIVFYHIETKTCERIYSTLPHIREQSQNVLYDHYFVGREGIETHRKIVADLHLHYRMGMG